MRKVCPLFVHWIQNAPGILTIRKSPSARIKRPRRSRWSPRSTNIPTSNAKGSGRSSGPQIRSPFKWDAHVPSSGSFPHNARHVRSKSVFVFSSVSSRSGCYDDSADRGCTSYEASRSVHEVASLPEPHLEEGRSGVQEVPIVSALLMSSFSVIFVFRLLSEFQLRISSCPLSTS